MSTSVPVGSPVQSSSSLPPAGAAIDPMTRLAQLELQLHTLQARGPHGPKAPPMAQFNGLMGAGGGGFEVDQWLRDANKQFAHYGARTFPTDQAKINFAVEWMSGAAQDWWENEDKSGITTWDSFVERLRQRYRPQMPAELARQRLRTLVQRGRCETYCNEFLKLAARIPDRSEEDKIFDFKMGLDRPLAAKVAEKQPKTLQEAMEIAVQAEPYVSFRSTGTGGNGQSYRSGFRQQSGMDSFGRTTLPANSGAAPMELNYAGYREESQEPPLTGTDTNAGDPAGGLSDTTQSGDVMQLMLAKMEAMENRLQSMQGGSSNRYQGNYNKSNTRSGGRNLIAGLTAADIISLQKEGKCFRCKQKGHMKNECPQNRLKH